MKLNQCQKFLLIAGVCYLSSCGKSTTIKGVVYSPAGVPMPKQVVHVPMFLKNGDNAKAEATAAITDADGRFELDFKIKKHRSYTIECYTDSGYYATDKFTKSPGSELTITLHQ